MVLFPRAIGRRLFYKAVVQVFEDSDLGLAEHSLFLFPRLTLTQKIFEGLFPVGLFEERKAKKGLELRLCFGSRSLEISGA